MQNKKAQQLYEKIIAAIGKNVWKAINENSSNDVQQLTFYYQSNKLDKVQVTNKTINLLKSDAFSNKEAVINVPDVNGVSYSFSVKVGEHNSCIIGMVEPYVGKVFKGQVTDCLDYMLRCIEKADKERKSKQTN